MGQLLRERERHAVVSGHARPSAMGPPALRIGIARAPRARAA